MSVIDIGQHRKNRADERIDVLTGQPDALLSLRAGRPEIRDYMESGARALMTEIAPDSLSGWVILAAASRRLGELASADSGLRRAIVLEPARWQRTSA